jgi:hypothetical protein
LGELFYDVGARLSDAPERTEWRDVGGIIYRPQKPAPPQLTSANLSAITDFQNHLIRPREQELWAEVGDGM